MSTPADRLIRAFLDAGNGHVAFRRRGGSPGYVHVVPAGFDPLKREHRLLAIELQNGTVCVTDELQQGLEAQPRPATSIRSDVLGHGAGPKYGRFRWALSHDAIIARWGNEAAFAEHVSGCFDSISERLNKRKR